MMRKLKIAIVGYGNVGRGVRDAIDRNPGTELSGIVTRNPERVAREHGGVRLFHLDDQRAWSQKLKADVAVLCGGSKDDLPAHGPLFARHFNTVDSFDTHADIPDYFAKLNRIAKRAKTTALISVGWDPGTFSLERVLADAFIPGASFYTFWGKGVSQGHSDAARRVKGVKDARQYTIPIESALAQVRSGANPKLTTREKHRRQVLVVADPGADQSRIAHAIKSMPKYYADYDTEVVFIDEAEMRSKHAAYPHAGFVLASGNTGRRDRALIEYRCEWGSNPGATGSIMVASARAAYRLNRRREYGAFTILDVPAADFSPRSRAELLRHYL